MHKSVLTLGVVLSLGTVGCSGLALQPSSSLAAQFKNQGGLDGLWVGTEAAPSQGLETPRYAEQSLGGLWSAGAEAVETVPHELSDQPGTQGDLWNPASVTRSWEVDQGNPPSPSRGLLFGDSSSGRIWY